MQRVPRLTASGRCSPREWLPRPGPCAPVSPSASVEMAIRVRSVSADAGGFGIGTGRRTCFVTGDRGSAEGEFER
jgi:hypothetical protein